jgi:acetyl esterase/lipase
MHTTLRYGPQRAQVAELWRPQGDAAERPVVVLIHGGFWRQRYTKWLMHRLARAVVAQGWVAYNIEYRRVGRFGSGGWPETFDDVASAINALATVPGIDRQHVVTCGHSAGGHLALWAGAERPSDSIRVCAAISLAGVVDLVEAARLGLGGGAVDALMGGSPDEYPDRYALGSPRSLLPMGIPQFLVHGLRDTTVPATLSEEYVTQARAHGDAAEFVPLPDAGHMEMIDPAHTAFDEVVARLQRVATPPPV